MVSASRKRRTAGRGTGMPDRLRVADVFGPTLQGEGPAAGHCAGFVRLMGCNLSCGWCDEPQTWDARRYNLHAHTQLLSVGEICAMLPSTVNLYVVTGGEPLLQQHNPAFTALVSLLRKRGPVHVETNGTIAPSPSVSPHVTTWVVSPKLAHAGPHRGRQDSRMHAAWRDIDNAHLKIVCQCHADVESALTLARQFRWPRHRIWLMPEGGTEQAVTARWPVIAGLAARNGVNASHRLHLLAGLR